MRRLLLVIVVLLLVSTAVLAQETTYVVQPGDTLGRIATRFGVTANAIATANNLPTVDLIYVGQILVIPGVEPTPAPTRAATVAPTSTPAPAVDTAGESPESTAEAPEATPEVVIPPEVTADPAMPQINFQLGGEVLSFAYPELMRRASMTWASSAVHWTQGAGMEIAQGAIDAARANDFRILLTVQGDPTEWAADPAAYNAAFAGFLAQVAALSPDAIQVWNNQNMESGWADDRVSAAAYTDLLRVAYSAIKTANPAVTVISGAPVPTPLFASCLPSGCEDGAYMRQMADAGAANYADCIGVQYTQGALAPYVSTGDRRSLPDHHSYYFTPLLDTVAGIFPDKPLCITRIGYLTSAGLPALPTAYEWATNTSLSEQAEWLAQAALQARNDGRVQLFIVWNVDSTVYGDNPEAGYAIVRSDGECIACIALNAAMRTQ
ncbi:MAG: LysM peptidoglycan-binding domain-containing protein [Anaerolineae bacterium]|nr:LysM peptidoglycan-binding domain-containing protein [Anaerolineae bacterium]